MWSVADSAGDLMEGGDGNDVFQTTDELGSTFIVVETMTALLVIRVTILLMEKPGPTFW